MEALDTLINAGWFDIYWVEMDSNFKSWLTSHGDVTPTYLRELDDGWTTTQLLEAIREENQWLVSSEPA